MTYVEHLSQCAAFLLCKCIRKVLTDGLVADAKQLNTWRNIGGSASLDVLAGLSGWPL